MGVQPLQVQALLGQEIVQFLERVDRGPYGRSIPASPALVHRQVGTLHLHRISSKGAAQLLDAD